jgi:hypothetical protein
MTKSLNGTLLYVRLRYPAQMVKTGQIPEPFLQEISRQSIVPPSFSQNSLTT